MLSPIKNIFLRVYVATPVFTSMALALPFANPPTDLSSMLKKVKKEKYEEKPKQTAEALSNKSTG